jgi:hypothetical protein
VRRQDLARAYFWRNGGLGKETYAEFTYENAVNFPALGAEGVEVRQFPADVVSAMSRASEELI